MIEGVVRHSPCSVRRREEEVIVLVGRPATGCETTRARDPRSSLPAFIPTHEFFRIITYHRYYHYYCYYHNRVTQSTIFRILHTRMGNFVMTEETETRIDLSTYALLVSECSEENNYWLYDYVYLWREVYLRYVIG